MALWCQGTTHVIRVGVRGAPSTALARGVGKAVVNSPLFKSAVAGGAEPRVTPEDAFCAS